jgi:small subunit ribosomal protein S17
MMIDAPTGDDRGDRKVRLGRVVSDKMEKTVVVEIGALKKHPLYRKRIRTQQRCKVHDPENTCRPGDLVRIMETRPLSRDKHWRVVEIVEKAR